MHLSELLTSSGAMINKNWPFTSTPVTYLQTCASVNYYCHVVREILRPAGTRATITPLWNSRVNGRLMQVHATYRPCKCSINLPSEKKSSMILQDGGTTVAEAILGNVTFPTRIDQSTKLNQVTNTARQASEVTAAQAESSSGMRASSISSLHGDLGLISSWTISVETQLHHFDLSAKNSKTKWCKNKFRNIISLPKYCLGQIGEGGCLSCQCFPYWSKYWGSFSQTQLFKIPWALW
jgi:hypothetical protein